MPFQEANIKIIVTHPQFYSAALFNDIAVVILNAPVKQNVNVVPICIPQQGLIFPPGIRCIGTGWGKNSFGNYYYYIFIFFFFISIILLQIYKI